jgi:glycosyltransferase involved in cell wall biosynthesis
VREAFEGLDTHAVRKRFAVGTDEKFVVFVGRLVPIKNPLGAIDVLASLPEQYSLVVIGDGPLETELKEYVREAGLKDRVHFAGTLPHVETLRAIATANALVLPSEEEAYPTAVFEALALGSLVVATPVGVLPDVEHERLHLNSVADFASTIETNIDAGGSDVDEDTLSRFSMERYTDQILSAFEERSTDGSDGAEAHQGSPRR